MRAFQSLSSLSVDLHNNQKSLKYHNYYDLRRNNFRITDELDIRHSFAMAFQLVQGNLWFPHIHIVNRVIYK